MSGAPLSADRTTDLLIIGAGPFGLAIADYVKAMGIEPIVVGVPMGFWRSNMPEGMYLRSTCNWSLDPHESHSIDRYLETTGRRCADVEPLSRDFYLDYAGWYQNGKDLQCVDATLTSLGKVGDEIVAVADNGYRIRSRYAVVATGFKDFLHIPADLAAFFPRERYEHTCHLVDFTGLRNRRVLIIGGRQSAFEWTALIGEAGASAVHVCYRHDTPRFETSEWAWVDGIVDNLAADSGWYRNLTEGEKEELNRRFWEEGRLKLEPWLGPRIDKDSIHLHPRTRVTGASARSGAIVVDLDSGERVTVDQVVFATGYSVDLERVPFLSRDLLQDLEIREGFPVLNERFETNVPGIYFTSLAATRDFGAFLAFTVSVRAQAKVIGEDIVSKIRVARRAESSAFDRSPRAKQA